MITPDAIPIYYVVMEQLVMPKSMVPVHIVLRSIECDLADTEKLYKQIVGPLQYSGRRISVIYIYREPASIVKARSEGEYYD